MKPPEQVPPEPRLSSTASRTVKGADHAYDAGRTALPLTFKISKSFFFLAGSSTHRTIWRTLGQGRFLSPAVTVTGSRRSWPASRSMLAGTVADTSTVWQSRGSCSKTSSTCCWKPIFNMVSAWNKTTAGQSSVETQSSLEGNRRG